MLLGSISSSGSYYVIGLKAVNCQNGDSLDEEQVEASRREDVLKKLHEAGTKMREKLGESLASIQKYDIPVEQATTPSLEALQAYSKALRERSSKGDPAALPLLNRAVELDPNFAMAYATVANVYFDLGDAASSVVASQKAFALRDRVTERERLYIDSGYYGIATGELEKEAQIYKEWQAIYPRDPTPYQNLALYYSYLGQYDQALERYQQSLQLEPNDAINYVSLAGTYLNLNRYDDAKATLAQLQTRQLTHELVPWISYLLAFLRNDSGEMKKWASPTAATEGIRDYLLASQADTEAFHGRLQNARDFSRRAVAAALQNGEPERAASWLAHAALREAELGNSAQARQDAAQALSSGSGKDMQTLAALALARAGDVNRAAAISDRLRRQSPTDTLLNRFWLPSIQAANEIDRRNPARAIELLKAAEPFELGGEPIQLDTLYPVYLRGLAFLLQRNGDAAAVEFQKMAAHPGRIANCVPGVLVYLQLSDAFAMSGNKRDARAALQHLLELWSNADPGSIVWRGAKAQKAKLQ